jgi:hypothetical protein
MLFGAFEYFGVSAKAISEIFINCYYSKVKALFSSYLVYFWNSVNKTP